MGEPLINVNLLSLKTNLIPRSRSNLVATAPGSDRMTLYKKAFVRFSRNQIIGALILLVIIWAVILFRMLSSGA
ncbi:MAG: hypothetical protein ACR2IB_02100 [Pyrinomonadaceae bacterium]